MSEDYSSIDKSQLISMIHFFEKRDEESKKENGALKELIKELQETHKQDVKTQSNLMKSIDRLTDQLANLTTQNKTLQQKINDLLTKS